jgi:hypothetical protein
VLAYADRPAKAAKAPREPRTLFAGFTCGWKAMREKIGRKELER